MVISWLYNMYNHKVWLYNLCKHRGRGYTIGITKGGGTPHHTPIVSTSCEIDMDNGSPLSFIDAMRVDTRRHRYRWPIRPAIDIMRNRRELTSVPVARRQLSTSAVDHNVNENWLTLFSALVYIQVITVSGFSAYITFVEYLAIEFPI